jgi:S-adenosylmethionine decarboxylase
MGIGRHILIDYHIKLGMDPIDLGYKVFTLMEKCIKEKSNMKIVHKHLEYLTVDTPPGFTAFLLLDQSHFSAHCYSEYGMLAIDLFTCGSTDPEAVIGMFQDQLKEITEELQVTAFCLQKRF